MHYYRISIPDLNEQADKKDMKIRAPVENTEIPRPVELIEKNKGLKIFGYGGIAYLLSRDEIEVQMPDDRVAKADAPIVRVQYSFAIFSDVTKMVFNMHRFYEKRSNWKWVEGVLTNMHNKNFSTLTWFPSVVEIEESDSIRPDALDGFARRQIEDYKAYKIKWGPRLSGTARYVITYDILEILSKHVGKKIGDVRKAIAKEYGISFKRARELTDNLWYNGMVEKKWVLIEKKAGLPPRGAFVYRLTDKGIENIDRGRVRPKDIEEWWFGA